MQLHRESFLAGLRGAFVLMASTVLTVAPSLRAQSLTSPEGAGVIKGRLVWDAGPVPKPRVLAKKDDPFVRDPLCRSRDHIDQSLLVDPATLGISNAIAYLVKPVGDYSAVEKQMLELRPTVGVSLINCDFFPYVTVVHKDQKLNFCSFDPMAHNVDFKPFNNTQINPMLPPNDKLEYQIQAAERRPTGVRCALYPWMRGWVFIVDHPFAVVTETDGSFEIKGVPAGVQHLVVWQSEAGYVNGGGNKGMAITVKAGETQDVGNVRLAKYPAMR